MIKTFTKDSIIPYWSLSHHMMAITTIRKSFCKQLVIQ